MTAPESTSPLGTEGIVELAVLERSGMIESRHLGAAIVVAADGSVLRELGDSSELVFGRSTLKFLQALTLLRLGVRLDGEQLVLAAASHQGTDRHIAVVELILERAGLGRESLQCPPDFPLDAATRHQATTRRRITMNCSGKHAAFLLACVRNDWPTSSYLDPAHPLQLVIRATVEEFTGEPVERVGVDGCGAPVFTVTLLGLARSMARLLDDPDGARLVATVRAHAWALDSPAIATAIDELGVVAKNGAEGVFVALAPNGSAVALKVIDGSTRASIAVGLALLASTGALDAEATASVIAATTEQVLGGGARVGALRVADAIASSG
ncbi:asparaginase [Salinibacterium sp.]|uniref:asparaginase n=1 Tax=Salinibacterium sp. TaxID=1915057 RepID=UPI00286C5C69|nr:asparaginase [Salinibacterium sp.]